jgi:Na+:H+ antiporter
MSVPFLFALLGGLLVLAVVANRLFRRTRVPDVIVLMAVGVLLGPVMGWVDPQQFQPVTHAFGTLAVILILFEAGLELDLRDTLAHFPGGLLLAVLAYFISVGLIAAVVGASLRLSLGAALLVGAALACTSSSITLPILQQIELAKPAQVTLLLEASLSDAFAVLSVGILLDMGGGLGDVMSNLAFRLLFHVVVSVLLAVLAAAVWSFLLPKLSEQRFWQVLTFAVVLLLYAGAERVHANGLICVLAFGLALSNLRRIDRRLLESSLGLEVLGDEHHAQMLSFHSELAFLVRTFFFVLIGVIVQFRELVTLLPAALGAVGAIVAARWLAVRASRWSRQGFPPAERELVFWIMPRGLITVVLALQIVQSGKGEFAFLPGLAFAAILATNLFVIVGSVRARRAGAPPAGAVSAADAPQPAETPPSDPGLPA